MYWFILNRINNPDFFEKKKASQLFLGRLFLLRQCLSLYIAFLQNNTLQPLFQRGVLDAGYGRSLDPHDRYVRHTHKTKDPFQVRHDKVIGLHGSFRIDASGSYCDINLFSLHQPFGPIGIIAESDAGSDNMVDPGFEAGMDTEIIERGADDNDIRLLDLPDGFAGMLDCRDTFRGPALG